MICDQFVVCVLYDRHECTEEEEFIPTLVLLENAGLPKSSFC